MLQLQRLRSFYMTRQGKSNRAIAELTLKG